MVLALNIKNSETNERLLKLRFDQLNFAKKLNLWQESYRIIEDINILMKNRKKTPSLVLNQYFKSISQIFWYSKFYLFHAIASYLHFANARK